MTRLSLTLLILAHLSGPPLAMAPVQDSYRVEVLSRRLRQTDALRLYAITHGLEVTGDFQVLRKERWR